MEEDEDLCREEHRTLMESQDEILQQLADLHRNLDAHINEQHKTVVSMDHVGEMRDALSRTQEQIDYMAEVVLGEVERNPIDGTVRRVGGMKSLVDAHQNGGLRTKMPKWVVTILTTMILALATLGAAQIEQHNTTDKIVNQVLQQVEQIKSLEHVEDVLP